MSQDLGPLQQRMGYVFLNVELLQQALTHSSYGHEKKSPDNERLEFIGDAVLQLAASSMLYKRFPKAREGEMSRLRSRLVNTGALASIAQSLEIGPLLRLGVGEADSGGRERESVLADAIEAILGAIFIDGDYEQAGGIAQDWIRDRLKILKDRRVDLNWKDPKSALQERLQRTHKLTPLYREIGREGPPHKPVYTVEVSIQPKGSAQISLGQGCGSSKKLASKAAAEDALSSLSNK